MLPNTVQAGLTAGLALWLVALPASAQEKAKSDQREEPRPGPVLPAGTRIPMVLQNSVNTKNARVGDQLYFQTIYPVVANNRILIPVGSYVRGSVTFAKRPGRIKGRGELHVRFDELTLPNGYTVKLQASLSNAGTVNNEEVNREEGGIKSDSSKAEDIGTVATSVAAGVGIGAAIGRGSGKGMGIGALVGVGAGLAAVLLTRGRELILPRGTTVEIALDRPLELDPVLVQFDWTGHSSDLPGPAPRPQQRNPLRPRIPF